ncbi:hypothetical protein K1719_003623 [Acacia pycnantha]|nr:hypothetical protein K1719_003623 [Acacia pycnantha]
MEGNHDRSWMYNRLTNRRELTQHLLGTTILERSIVKTQPRCLTPTLFDSMEHLPVHLAYEAKVGGPQQYRWMYPFERFLRTLKNKIKNPRYVEGSIAEAYLVEEAAKFASYYYPRNDVKMERVPRNDDAGDTRDQNQYLIFQASRGKTF